MSGQCKYCRDYIERARREVEHFDEACQCLRLDPDNPRDAVAIVRGLRGIGAHGAIRLARQFPFVTDEAQFAMCTQVGLHFYWMTLDFWQEMRDKQAAQQKAVGKAS